MRPPRWLLGIGWAVHRVLYRASGGRIGLRAPGATALGRLRLRTIGRRSGEPRETFLYYVEDSRDIAIVASNAGADVPPAWYLNLRAHPHAEIDVPGEHRLVWARDATSDERARIYPRFVKGQASYGEYERMTKRPIPVVILERRSGSDA
jgi:deazaflavin-dependent oxidoreductase (nitroreductase family)